jgi:uncharacterized iron-regulated membrane protein
MHAWSGAVLALLLVVLGLSGTLLVFKDDYLRASFPEARAGIEPTPDNLAIVAERAGAVYGERLVSAVFGTPEMGLTRLYLTNGDAAYLGPDGATVAVWSGTGRPEAWLFDLHHHLLAGDTGELVAGIAGLAAVLLTITGLVAIWPARRAIGARIWPRSARRGDMLAAHRNLGLVAALPVALLCLTGSAMVFSVEARALLTGFRSSGDAVAGTAPPPWQAASDIDWSAGLAAAQAQFPQATIRIARWPSDTSPAISLRLRQRAEWHPNGRTYVLVDGAASQTRIEADSEAHPLGLRIYNALYPLHSSHLGRGLPGRIYDLFSALAGLALTALGLVGLWAFLTHRVPSLRARAA